MIKIDKNKIDINNISEQEIIDLLTNKRYLLSYKFKEELEYLLEYKYKNMDIEITGYTRYFKGNKEYYRNEIEWNILCKYHNKEIELTEEEKLKIQPRDLEDIYKTLDRLELCNTNKMAEIEKEILLNMMSYKEEDMW